MNTRRMSGIAVCLLALVGLYFVVSAGDLEPPGPPAPTMVTLQEIYDRVSASPVGVPKTGQTGCWNTSAVSIPCAGTGQDGEYQAGVSVTPRFADNGDGTVQDNLTGLIWLKDADCFGVRDFSTALSDANGLANGSCGLTDSSVAGDWRLPNIRELQSLIDYGQGGPALPVGHPFSGVVLTGRYGSSSSYVFARSFALVVSLNNGFTDSRNKINSSSVWPVRGGL